MPQVSLIDTGSIISKIDVAIAPSNFEYVRDQIGAILKIELDNQANLWGISASHAYLIDNVYLQNGFYLADTATPLIPDTDLTAEVWVERFTPIDRVEGNTIEVGILKMDLDNQTPISQRNSVNYAIDVFVNAKEIGEDDGCYLSGAKLHRLIGLIRAIIQNPIYDKLGFAPGFIERRSIKQILFSEKDDNHDTINSRMARIILQVDMHEESSGIQPIQASNYQTVVKLAATEKGHKFIYINS
jgi:hypothetical protein